MACLGAIGVWEASTANRAWALLLNWLCNHLDQADLNGFNNCVTLQHQLERLDKTNHDQRSCLARDRHSPEARREKPTRDRG